MLIHGIDIININRHEFKNENLYKKILHEYEYKNYFNSSLNERYIMLAKLWSIKEALYKSLPIKITMNEMLVEKINDTYHFKHENYDFNISISSTDDLIIASVIGIKKYA